MRGTGVELACFYWVAPPEEAGHRLAFLGHHHERDRRAEAPRAQTYSPRRARSASVRALSKDPQVGEVSVLAHSMGNWVTLEALRQMAIRSDAA